MMNHVTGYDFEYWFQFHEVQKHRNHKSENIVAFWILNCELHLTF